MAHPGPGGRPADASRLAKLALLGVGTLATGALGALAVAAGYKVKKSNAAHPEQVTPMSYLEDLSNGIAPWDKRSGSGSAGSAHAAGSSSASPPAPQVSSEHAVLSEAQRLAELRRLEVLGEAEESDLRFSFDPRAFAHIHTSSRTFPLSPALLARVCTFLPYEHVAELGGVSCAFRDFSSMLLSDRGFLFEQAASRAGFSEQHRGDIWMRISGAAALATSMSQRASKTAKCNFYEHLVAQTIGYRELLIRQNGLGNRAPVHGGSASAASASSSSPSLPLSAEAAAVDLSDLTDEARSALDTVLKDVPRTLVPSNAASRSMINHAGVVAVERHVDDLEGLASPLSPGARRRQEIIDKLSNVLSVYCIHDTELGYCQGMNFVAAFLLQHLPEQDAYWLYYKVMQDSAWNLRRFYVNGLHGLLVCKFQFARLFDLFLPRLSAHFRAQEVHADLFVEWLLTLFTFPSFPRRSGALERLWDLLLVSRGLKFLFRFALAILAQAEDTLLAYEFEQILFYIKALPDDGILDPAELVPLAVTRFKAVSNRALKQLEEEYEKQQAAQKGS